MIKTYRKLFKKKEQLPSSFQVLDTYQIYVIDRPNP